MKRIFPLRGPLIFVAVLFCASAVLRIILYADSALALAQELSPHTEQTQQTCDAPYDIGPVLQAINDQRAELDERSANLAQNEAALRVIKQNIDQQLAALEQTETRLSEMVALSQSASKTDLEKLTAVYSAMNPKQAALLFETMEPDFAAGFLALLDPQIAAEIMAGLTPEKAYALSVIVAGRNANAPIQ